MNTRTEQLVIQLPTEFLELCELDLVTPECVLRGFIADQCSMSNSNNFRSGSIDDRDRARGYYERIYAFRAQWFRKNCQHLIKDGQPFNTR